MKGKHFLEIVNNQIVAQGMIEESAGPGFWAVRFVPMQKGIPPATRVIPAQNMQAMMMFDSPQEMQQFAQAWAAGQQQQGPEVEVKTPADMTKAELVAACEGLGIEIPSKVSKAQLIALLEANASEQ